MRVVSARRLVPCGGVRLLSFLPCRARKFGHVDFVNGVELASGTATGGFQGAIAKGYKGSIAPSHVQRFNCTVSCAPDESTMLSRQGCLFATTKFLYSNSASPVHQPWFHISTSAYWGMPIEREVPSDQ